jgi:leucyl aminopeptidase
MLTCYTNNANPCYPLTALTPEQFNHWFAEQSEFVKKWIQSNNFLAAPETFCVIPDAKGAISEVIFGIKNQNDFWPYGVLPKALPTGNYKIQHITNKNLLNQIAIAWGLGAYQFNHYKVAKKKNSQLFIDENYDYPFIENIVSAIYGVRDLINTPTEDMGPAELADAAKKLAHQFNAEVTQIVGKDLLEKNYPTIYAVGRASSREPRLIDLRWGEKSFPKITLIGKGVCFDSGGLDIKNSSSMFLMKKDMGGAAHALGLAQMIMSANLSVNLRVLIPAVENVISGNAYKPGDIIRTRKGLTVEVGNTDGEGRLILCDALAEAVDEKPELIIDFATLTGAARVAVGTEITAMFTDDENLAEKLQQHARVQQDPLWRLPLYTPYRKLLDTPFADINNCGFSPYAGAITAGLFLKEFVPAQIPWVHLDFMGWNISTSAGHPEGGEAMGLRAIFAYLAEKYS